MILNTIACLNHPHFHNITLVLKIFHYFPSWLSLTITFLFILISVSSLLFCQCNFNLPFCSTLHMPVIPVAYMPLMMLLLCMRNSFQCFKCLGQGLATPPPSKRPYMWHSHSLSCPSLMSFSHLLSQLCHLSLPSQNVRTCTHWVSSPQFKSNHSPMLCYFYSLSFCF